MLELHCNAVLKVSLNMTLDSLNQWIWGDSVIHEKKQEKSMKVKVKNDYHHLQKNWSPNKNWSLYIIASLLGFTMLRHACTPLWMAESLHSPIITSNCSSSSLRTHHIWTLCQKAASTVLSGYKSWSYQCLKQAQAKEMQAARASVRRDSPWRHTAGRLTLRRTSVPDQQTRIQTG